MPRIAALSALLLPLLLLLAGALPASAAVPPQEPDAVAEPETAQVPEVAPPVEEILRAGIELHDQGDYAGAIAKYEEALRHYPGHPVALYELAHTQATRGEYDRCIEAAEEGVKAEAPPALTAQLYAVMASCFSSSGRPNKALRQFRKGLEIAPDSVPLLFNIAVTLATQGEHAEAAHHLERAIRLQPRYPSPYYLLAEIQRAEDRRVPGLLLFTRFVTLEPNSPRAVTASSLVIALLGAGAEASEDGQQVTITMPESEGPYDVAEMMLAMAGTAPHIKDPAEEGEDPPPPTEAARHVEVLVLFFKMLGDGGAPDGEADSATWQMAAVPLLELADGPELETLGYLMASRAGVAGGIEWLDAHPERLRELEAAISP
jgi:tetratricopeptide (TPR) repeat protein